MNYKKLIGVAAVTAGFAGLSTYTYQAVAASFNVTTTVSTAITFANTVPMNFGTIYAKAGSLSYAELIMAADGTISSGASSSTGAQIISLDSTSASQGIFDVTGAAAFTDLTISYAGSAVGTGGKSTLLTNDSSAPNKGVLQITAFHYAHSDGTASKQTDGTGALTFHIGATVRTLPDASENAFSATGYTGTYKVEVTY